MTPNLRIHRTKNSANSPIQSTTIELSGSLATMQLRIVSRLNARTRRAMGVALFRHMRPFLQYFRNQSVIHSETLPTCFYRAERRGLKLFKAKTFTSSNAKLGFEIKSLRLQCGLSQADLARLSSLSRHHISRLERGLYQPRTKTRRGIFEALNRHVAHPMRFIV